MKKFVRKHEQIYKHVTYMNSVCDEIENEFYINYREIYDFAHAVKKVAPLYNKATL